VFLLVGGYPTAPRVGVPGYCDTAASGVKRTVVPNDVMRELYATAWRRYPWN
jgi:hypothetical protein